MEVSAEATLKIHGEIGGLEGRRAVRHPISFPGLMRGKAREAAVGVHEGGSGRYPHCVGRILSPGRASTTRYPQGS